MTESQMRFAWGEPVQVKRDSLTRTFCYDSACRKAATLMGRTVVDVQVKAGR